MSTALDMLLHEEIKKTIESLGFPCLAKQIQKELNRARGVVKGQQYYTKSAECVSILNNMVSRGLIVKKYGANGVYMTLEMDKAEEKLYQDEGQIDTPKDQEQT